MPTPPGVIGTADSSRENAKTANASAVETSCSETPRCRRDSSRTENSASWLSTVVQVSRNHRCSTSAIVSRRKRAAPWPHARRPPACGTALDGGDDATRTSPSRSRSDREGLGLRNTRANRPTATLRTTTPTTAAAMYAGVRCPLSASSTSARTGRPSFVKMFQMPGHADVQGDVRAGEPPRVEDRVGQPDRDRPTGRQRVRHRRRGLREHRRLADADARAVRPGSPTSRSRG